MAFKADLKTIGAFYTILFFLFLTISLPIIFPMQTLSEQIENIQENNIRIEKTTPITIFTNNFAISIITLIPYLGWGYILFAMWNTGLVIASYSNALVLLLLNPFAWIELSVNAFVVLMSYKLLRLALNKHQPGRLKLLVTHTILVVLIVAAVLLTSACLEYIVVAWGR